MQMGIAKKPRVLANFSWASLIFCCLMVCGCGTAVGGDAELTKQTYMELVDWHVSGLWVINSPVAWIRVLNYNSVPIHNISFQYNTFDADGTPLDEGTYNIEDTVQPGQTRNFIELYLGVVNLHSEKLNVKLLAVSRAD
jgi:hypothetical protein